MSFNVRPPKTAAAPMIARILTLTATILGSAVFARAADELPDLNGPALGVKVVALADTKDAFKEDKIELPTKIGVILVHVEPHGPAANAKLQRMDVVTNVNRKAIKTADEFKATVSSLTIGKEYEVAGYRASEVRGKITWKKGTVKVSPVSVRDVYLNAMREKTDEVRGTTSYTHRDSSEFVNSHSDFYAYFVQGKSGIPSLRLQIQYVADDWLFIKRFTIKADEQTFTLTPTGLRDVERGNKGGKIWEWHDRAVGAPEREMLNAIATAKKVILRCEGNQYQKDRELSDSEVNRIRTVLMAYQIKGGK